MRGRKAKAGRDPATQGTVALPRLEPCNERPGARVVDTAGCLGDRALERRVVKVVAVKVAAQLVEERRFDSARLRPDRSFSMTDV
jgi:hypothetical protein